RSRLRRLARDHGAPRAARGAGGLLGRRAAQGDRAPRVEGRYREEFLGRRLRRRRATEARPRPRVRRYARRPRRSRHGPAMTAAARAVRRATVVVALAAAISSCAVTTLDQVCNDDPAEQYCVGPIANIPVEHKERMEQATKLALAVVGSSRFQSMMAEVRNRLVTDPKYGKDWSRFAVGDVARAARKFSIQTSSLLSSLVSRRTYAWARGAGRILGNRLNVGQRPAYGWAGILVHELAHQAGYAHDGNNPKGNECSVPYAAGDVAEFLAFQLLKSDEKQISALPCERIRD